MGTLEGLRRRNGGGADLPPASITAAKRHRQRASELLDSATATERRARDEKRELTPAERRDVDKKAREAEEALDVAEAMETEVAAEKRADYARKAAQEGEAGAGPLSVELEDGRVLRGMARDESIEAALPELRESRVVAEHPELDSTQERREAPSLGATLRALARGPRTDSERRAMASASITAGGALLSPVLSAQIVDDSRRASRVIRAGATTLPIPEGGSLKVVKVLSDLAPGWRGESAAVAESEPTFGAHTIVPYTAAAKCHVPLELLEDASGLDGALRRLFGEAFANEVDRVCLRGGADGDDELEPGGLETYLNTALSRPIPTVDMGAAAGAAFTNWDPFVDAQYEIASRNGEPPTVAVMHPRSERDLGKLKSATELLPLPRPEALRNLRLESTTQVTITDSHGTAEDATKVWMGGWRSLIFCPRTEITVRVLDQVRLASNLEYVFLGYMRFDVAVFKTGDFAAITGIIPPS